MAYSKEQVKENIELEDVYILLDFFGAEPEMFDDYIIAKTVCHNGDSRKLFYYENTSLFRCYTHCGTFDIFEFIQKVKGIDDLNAAIYFVVQFLNLQHSIDDLDESLYNNEDWKIFNRYEKISELNVNTSKLELPEYDISMLQYYPKPRIIPWEKDGISKEVCDYMNICYDPVDGNIIIPHFDIDGRCIGIRQRTLVQEQEKWGKYRPWHKCNHPLSFNLYGLDNAKDRIADMQTAIIVESEKSVLQYESYFGTANNICVAVCGSSISQYQFQLLQELGIKEMVIAFDRDYNDYQSKESLEIQEKIAKVANKFAAYVNVSVLLDKENLLDYKASPLDCGKDAFLYLFKNRIMI